MKVLLLILGTLCMAALSLVAQEVPQERIEVLVKEGASSVEFRLEAPQGSSVRVHWGDGKSDVYLGSSEIKAYHQYASALEKPTTVLVEASALTGFSKALHDEVIIGFGKINAPLLEKLIGAAHKGTLKGSENNVVNLSQCPRLKVVKLLNPPALVLGMHPSLTTFWLHSEGDKAHPDYAAVTAECLDLSPYSKLEKLEVYGQQIKECNLTGLTALKSLVYIQNGTSRAPGLRERTKSTLLTRLDFTFNHIGIHELPLRNANVEYALFDYYQRAYIIPNDKIDKAQINLKYLAFVNGWDGLPQATTFAWKKGNKIVPVNAYKEENGLFSFNTNLFDAGEEEAKIHVLIANPLFPNTELAAIVGSQYGSQEITLKKSETPSPEAREEVRTQELAFILLNEGKSLFVKGIDAGESAQIFDLTGRLLLQAGVPYIDISALPYGIYVVRAADKAAKIAKSFPPSI